MPLTATGQEAKTETGVNARATNSTGEVVIVSATCESIQDYGWGTIWAVASDKYDSDNVDRDGPVPKVAVSTADCKEWSNDA